MRWARRGRIVAVVIACALATAASAWAFQALPPGGQVNDDPAAGIDKTKGASGEDPTNADVAGGALTAGKVAVPWAVFRQQTTGADQVFARSFAGGAWTTRGSGTVGGRSSAAPTFSGSLNFDQGQDGEAPAIDFAGSGRTVPWATWYEETSGAGFGHENIFASRFDNTGGPNQGKWIFGGQGRGTGGGSVPVPSLNIHTDQDAENPSVAGGSAVDPTKPGPWVTWQETSPETGSDQIFVERPIGPGAANCDGVEPVGLKEGEHVPAVGGFCWQQVGIPRLGGDPTLNVDPTREGIEPDIAFTGPNDSVPWVVWYETEETELEGPGSEDLHENEMVFAAKGVKDEVGANGGFHWVAVGTQLSGTLDTSGTNKFGTCAESALNESHCSLNKNPERDAEDPRVAAGTMNPANPTVPWVAWDEDLGGVKQVFVARLVEGTHFELANGGAPISTGANDSTRPDITFAGNTPYVSWREDIGGGVEKGFYGHFVNASNPTFVLDENNVPLSTTAAADVREPISSGCTATPFNVDGAACQGGAVGTPFFLFTTGSSPLSLFADAYAPEPPVTGGASGVSSSAATVSGSVNPAGAAVDVFFEYGPTAAYGLATPAQRTEVSDVATPFSASLTGLAAGATLHYRAVAVSDFGTFVGADQTLTTQSLPAPQPTGPPQHTGPSPSPVGSASAAGAKVSGSAARVRVSCTGPAGASCRILVRLTVKEVFKGRKLVSVKARAKLKRKVVTVGTAAVTLSAGSSRTVRVALNHTGKRLLARRHKLRVKLHLKQSLSGGQARVVRVQTLTFKAAKHKHR